MARQRASLRVRESARYRAELRRFGVRLRRHRTAKHLTLEMAAEKIDIDVTHLTKIEGGKINLTFATIVRIAAGLAMSVSELMAE